MSAFPAAGGTTSASSASMPALLEGHRLDVRISRRGRDDLRVVRKLCSPTSPRQKTWKIGLPILHHNRPIRSPFTAGAPSPVSALGRSQLCVSASPREYPAQANSPLSQ